MLARRFPVSWKYLSTATVFTFVLHLLEDLFIPYFYIGRSVVGVWRINDSFDFYIYRGGCYICITRTVEAELAYRLRYSSMVVKYWCMRDDQNLSLLFKVHKKRAIPQYVLGKILKIDVNESVNLNSVTSNLANQPLRNFIIWHHMQVESTHTPSTSILNLP